MTGITKVTRYHDFCAGHRVCGHEGKCRHLHGHNYRVFFTIEGSKDSIGRVLDFSVIKDLLCEWLERNWDHRFLVYIEDPLADCLIQIDPSVVQVPFNPTAENMASYLVNVIAPVLLEPEGVILTKVEIEETRKCSASYEIQFDGDYNVG